MTKTITRALLSAAATRRTGLENADVSHICERMFALIGERLMEGETVKLTAFASLQVRPRAERLGRNPRTGEEHKIGPRHTVTLTPSVKLREKLDAALDAKASRGAKRPTREKIAAHERA